MRPFGSIVSHLASVLEVLYAIDAGSGTLNGLCSERKVGRVRDKYRDLCGVARRILNAAPRGCTASGLVPCLRPRSHVTAVHRS